MTPEEARNLEANGWRFGNYADFLGLSPAQAAGIEVKHSLRRLLKQCREERGWTQIEAAKQIGISQSQYSTMEKGHPQVSLDQLVQALTILGVSAEHIGEAIRTSEEEVRTTSDSDLSRSTSLTEDRSHEIEEAIPAR
jgi:transcriptional regulator with XRE-family HTH domain